MPLKRGSLVAALLGLAPLVLGCGTAQAPADRPAPGPTRLQPAAEPGPGSHRVVCRMRTPRGERRVALALPEGFRPGPANGARDLGGCSWQRPVRVPQDDPGGPATYRSSVIVTLTPVGGNNSLDDRYRQARRDAVAGDSPAGDDSVLHLRRVRGVPVFGATVGDRLELLCYCDGQNLLYRYRQAYGVLLAWTADLPLRRRTDRWLRSVAGGVGTVG